MVPAMAGQLLAEPSIRHQKERSFFPFFGEEERSRSFRSRIGSAQPTAGQPKAGKPEAARVGREGGATVSVRSRGVLPRRGQETPSSKLLAANRTEGGRQRADGQGSNRGVRRIWLHKCTGPRKRRDTEKTPAKPVSAAAEPPLGGQYIPLCLCGGWWRVERSDTCQILLTGE